MPPDARFSSNLAIESIAAMVCDVRELIELLDDHDLLGPRDQGLGRDIRNMLAGEPFVTWTQQIVIVQQFDEFPHVADHGRALLEQPRHRIARVGRHACHAPRRRMDRRTSAARQRSQNTWDDDESHQFRCPCEP